MYVRCLALLATLSCCVVAEQSPDRWTVVQDAHFEVYSHTGDDTAQQALTWFEQLRTFLLQNGLPGASFTDQGRPPLEVIGFHSEKEYEEYRLRPSADAYHVADGRREYVVMATLQRKDFRVAAHEYAHYVLHVSGLTLPTWLNEGLAESFSTLRVNPNSYELGGDLPARTRTLRSNKWLPLTTLLNGSGPVEGRSEIFYAESWALADMLMTSPRYEAHFRQLVAELNAGSDTVWALWKVYGVSLDELTKSLEDWVGRARSARVLFSRPAASASPQVSILSDRQTRALLARVSFVSGHLQQARIRYAELLRDEPENPDFHAALGAVALRQGNRDEARGHWQQALRNKVTDPELCYQYAQLVQDMGSDEQEAKSALERAVELAPDFDDARYRLALMENQAGEYRSAVEQLRAMHVPAGERRHAYWIALASALIELDQRDEAKQAAQEAFQAATSEAERMTARRMMVVAATDLTVQFSTDAEGRSQMVTTRVPHGTREWNPFIEPSDKIQHLNGTLNEVLCDSGKLTGFVLLTSEGPLTVDVPDPLHVLIRNSPDEFFCGPVQGKAVEADYAIFQAAGRTTKVLRGMKFE